MKKLSPRLLALLCCVLLIPGCAPPSRRQVTAIKIGVALYEGNDTFISTVLSNLEREAKARQQEDGLKITLDAADGAGNQGVQNDQVDRFLRQGYDVICVNMVDRTAAAVIIDKARSADVPVIFFNREPVEEDLQRWDQLFYVGSASGEAGMLQGQIVADAYAADPASVDRNGDGKLQYVMLEGEPGHQDTLLRTEFSVKAVSAAGIGVEKLANDTANWQRGQAATKAAQWYESFGDQIEVVFSNNDDMALGAIDALKAAGADPLPLVVGVDATPPALEAIRAGTLAGTVLNDSQGQAKVIMDLACALALGKDPGKAATLEGDKYIRLPGEMITWVNVNEVAPGK